MWKTHNKIHKLNSSSTVITWSAICSRFSLSATPVTCDSLSFKNIHLITTMKSCLTRFTTRNYFLLNFKENYHVQRTVPGIPVMNKTHPIKVPHLSILIQNLYYIQTSMWQHSQYSNQYIHWKICSSNLCRSNRTISSPAVQTSSSTHPASNLMKTRALSVAVKWPGQTVWPLTSL